MTARQDFEAEYQRSADDPSSAEMLAIWEAAWQAATERAAKIADEKATRINSVWIARDIARSIRGPQ